MQASYPAIGNAKKSLLEALTEVHLRRLDTDDTLHRRAVAVIAIEATPDEVHPSALHLKSPYLQVFPEGLTVILL